MNAIKLKITAMIAEMLAAYGLLAYTLHGQMISLHLFFLLTVFIGLMFALYYGVTGAIGAIIVSVFTIYFALPGRILSFMSQYFVESSFFLAGLMITGFVKSGMERKAIGSDLTNRILNRRVEKLTMDLSERDRALKDAFQEVLMDRESPKIMYQALRRIEQIENIENFFEEILYILYTHCHAEKSSIYKLEAKNSFRRVVSFGTGDLPDLLKWKSDGMPDILRVASAEKEVIIPREMENRYVLAIPVLDSFDRLNYLLLVEEIRFINLSENIINLLKVAAFWIKSLIENRLHMDELRPLSAFESVIAYRPDISPRLLKKNVDRYRRYDLDYSLLRIRGQLPEEEVYRLSSALRLYDEFYMIKEDEMIIFLSMVIKENVPFVVNRLRSNLPELEIEETRA